MVVCKVTIGIERRCWCTDDWTFAMLCF